MTTLLLVVALNSIALSSDRIEVGLVQSMTGSGRFVSKGVPARPLTKADLKTLRTYSGDQMKVTAGEVRVGQDNGVVHVVTPKKGWYVLKYRLNDKQILASNVLMKKTRSAVAKGPGGFEWPNRTQASSAQFVVVDPKLPATATFEFTQTGELLWKGTLTRKSGGYTSDELRSRLGEARRDTEIKMTVAGRSETFKLFNEDDEAELRSKLAEAQSAHGVFDRLRKQIEVLNTFRQAGPATVVTTQLGDLANNGA